MRSSVYVGCHRSGDTEFKGPGNCLSARKSHV